MASTLFHAVESGHCGRVMQLVDWGADVHWRNKDGDSVLHAAVLAENLNLRKRTFDFLVKAGADCLAVNKRTGMTVLMNAAKYGRHEQVMKILKEVGGEVDLTETNTLGMTPLHYATIGNHFETAHQLVKLHQKYQITVDTRDSLGLSAYLYARKLDYEELAEMLLHEGSASPLQFDDLEHYTAAQLADVGRLERQQTWIASQRQIASQMMMHGMRNHTRALQSAIADGKSNSYNNSPRHISPRKSLGVKSSSQTLLEFAAKANQIRGDMYSERAPIEFRPSQPVAEESAAKPRGYKPQPASHVAIMTSIREIQSDMGSLSFRPSMRAPEPKPEVPLKVPKRKKMSSLAIIFAKSGNKGGSKRPTSRFTPRTRSKAR